MSQPEIMRNAVEDLSATVEGRFSPSDWELIVERAEDEFRARVGSMGELGAWHEVMRDFRQKRYWGFQPNYRAPKVKKEKNLGVTLIWMAFNSMCVFKVGILWFGQIYTRSDEPFDKWIFFGLIALIISNYVYFLWRHRGYKG